MDVDAAIEQAVVYLQQSADRENKKHVPKMIHNLDLICKNFDEHKKKTKKKLIEDMKRILENVCTNNKNNPNHYICSNSDDDYEQLKKKIRKLETIIKDTDDETFVKGYRYDLEKYHTHIDELDKTIKELTDIDAPEYKVCENYSPKLSPQQLQDKYELFNELKKNNPNFIAELLSYFESRSKSEQLTHNEARSMNEKRSRIKTRSKSDPLSRNKTRSKKRNISKIDFKHALSAQQVQDILQANVESKIGESVQKFKDVNDNLGKKGTDVQNYLKRETKHLKDRLETVVRDTGKQASEYLRSQFPTLGHFSDFISWLVKNRVLVAFLLVCFKARSTIFKIIDKVVDKAMGGHVVTKKNNKRDRTKKTSKSTSVRNRTLRLSPM